MYFFRKKLFLTYKEITQLNPYGVAGRGGAGIENQNWRSFYKKKQNLLAGLLLSHAVHCNGNLTITFMMICLFCDQNLTGYILY